MPRAACYWSTFSAVPPLGCSLKVFLSKNGLFYGRLLLGFLLKAVFSWAFFLKAAFSVSFFSKLPSPGHSSLELPSPCIFLPSFGLFSLELPYSCLFSQSYLLLDSRIHSLGCPLRVCPLKYAIFYGCPLQGLLPNSYIVHSRIL